MKKFLVLLFVCVFSIKGADKGEYRPLLDVNGGDDSKEAAHLDTLDQQFNSFHIPTSSSVTAVQYAPDGSIAYGLDDGTVRTVDPKKPLENKIVALDFNKRSLSCSPNGNIAYGRITSPYSSFIKPTEEHKSIAIYNIEANQAHIIKADDIDFSPTSLDWFSDGQHIAFCGRVVGFVNTATREVRKWRGHDSDCTVVRCSPYGLLASGAVDNIVKIWNVESQECKHSFEGHYSTITTLDWNPRDVNQVASGSKDTTVRLWDVRSNKPIALLKKHTREITALHYHPDGNKLVTGSGDGTVRLWDLRRAAMLLAKKNRGVTSLSVHPNGSHVVYGAWNSGLSAVAIPDEVSDELQEDAMEIGVADDDASVESDGRCCIVM